MLAIKRLLRKEWFSRLIDGLLPVFATLAALLVGDGQNRHVTAESLFVQSSATDEKVSLATVYNTLQALLSRGELAEIKIGPSRARFDPCTGRHAHLMCVKCGEIADVRVPRRPPVPGGKPRGFRVLHCNIEFYGVCPACGRKAAPRKRRAARKK